MADFGYPKQSTNTAGANANMVIVQWPTKACAIIEPHVAHGWTDVMGSGYQCPGRLNDAIEAAVATYSGRSAEETADFGFRDGEDAGLTKALLQISLRIPGASDEERPGLVRAAEILTELIANQED